MSTPALTPLLSFKAPAVNAGVLELPVMVSCGEWTTLTADAHTMRRVAKDIIAAVDAAPPSATPTKGKLAALGAAARRPIAKPGGHFL
jgi:hypothetical protein